MTTQLISRAEAIAKIGATIIAKLEALPPTYRDHGRADGIKEFEARLCFDEREAQKHQCWGIIIYYGLTPAEFKAKDEAAFCWRDKIAGYRIH
mgnify:CR=1 FL=1